MAKPVRIAWQLDTPRDIETTWEAFSDTDRFNLVAEMGLRFAEEARADGTTQRTGFIRHLGMDISWEEEPFNYRRPHWFHSVRRFHGGPAQDITTTLRLRPNAAGGTHIDYEVQSVPRNFASRVLVSLDMRQRLRPAIDRTLTSLLGNLASNESSADDAGWRPPALTDRANALLARARLSESIEPAAFDAIESFLRTAPLREQSRISPLHLADVFGLPVDDVVTTLLACVDLGVLTLRLDISCPYCRGPQPIPNESGDAHCPSCNVRFDRSFPNSVIVHFEPTSTVRPTKVHIECLGSPARQPHVVGQDTVAPGELCTFDIELPPGVYQLRTLPPHGPPVPVLVYETDSLDSPTILLAPRRTKTRAVRARPGPVRLTIQNATNTPARIMLCHQKQYARLLTAGVLWEEFPESHAYVPKRYFKSTTSRHGAAIALHDPEDPRGTALASVAQGAHLWFEARTASIAVFDSRAAALTCIAKLGSLTNQWVGYGEGPVFEVDMGDGPVPMGSAINQAVSAMHGAGPGAVAMPQSWANSPHMASEIAALGLWREPSPFPGAGGEGVVWLSPRA